MSLIKRDMLIEDALDRIDALESALRDLQDNSSIPPAVTPDEPGWSAFSGWVVTGRQLQDVNGYIILDPSTPAIEINDDTGLQAQLGKLDDIVDADLSPSGYGLYSANVFLKGDLHAAGGDVVIDTSGITIKADTDIVGRRIKFTDGDAGTSYELGSVGVVRAVSNAAMSISTKPREVADAYSYMTLSVNKFSGAMRSADLTLLYDYISIDNYVNDRDLRVSGDLVVGTATDAPDHNFQVVTTVASEGAHIGNAYAGNWSNTGFTQFGHWAMRGAAGYGMIQAADGTLYLSSATGTLGFLRVNNTDVAGWDATHFKLYLDKCLSSQRYNSAGASAWYAGYTYVPLTTPIVIWNGYSASSTAAATQLNWYSSGVPRDAVAVAVMLDCTSATVDNKICLTPQNNITTAAVQSLVLVTNKYFPSSGIVPTTAHGSGGCYSYWWTVGTVTAYLNVWGYFI